MDGLATNKRQSPQICANKHKTYNGLFALISGNLRPFAANGFGLKIYEQEMH